MADETHPDTTNQTGRTLSPTELLEAEEVIRRERYLAEQHGRARRPGRFQSPIRSGSTSPRPPQAGCCRSGTTKPRR